MRLVSVARKDSSADGLMLPGGQKQVYHSGEESRRGVQVQLLKTQENNNKKNPCHCTHKQILQGGIAGGSVSLQCMGPSSELGHHSSSALPVALRPDRPQGKASHASCQQDTRTHAVFSTAR